MTAPSWFLLKENHCPVHGFWIPAMCCVRFCSCIMYLPRVYMVVVGRIDTNILKQVSHFTGILRPTRSLRARGISSAGMNASADNPCVLKPKTSLWPYYVANTLIWIFHQTNWAEWKNQIIDQDLKFIFRSLDHTQFQSYHCSPGIQLEFAFSCKEAPDF